MNHVDFFTQINEPIEADDGAKNLAQRAFLQLQEILEGYLDRHQGLTINGISQRSGVSEPTLRRIKKGQSKRIPNATTVVTLLSYISKEKGVKKIISQYPGPLAEFLTEKFPEVDLVESKDFEIAENLKETFKDPINYIIYKMASNDIGVEKAKILELLGPYGERVAIDLCNQGVISEKEGCYFGSLDGFAVPIEGVQSALKATLGFLKPEKIANAPKNLGPVYCNFSNNVSKEAYSEIVKIQKAAQRKIVQVMLDESKSGDVPAFVLMATDTLDSEIAGDF